MVAMTYLIFYYEAANGSHLEILRSRGRVSLLLFRGFIWSLYSHLMVLATTMTAFYRSFYRLPPGPVDRTPILFVHGLYHNYTAFYLYLRWFRKWGWQHVKALNLPGKFRSIQDFGEMLSEEIDEVLTETGSNQVDLVGHSMGGLVIRSYLANNPETTKVRRVVTLGSPHAGSKLAVLGVGKAVKEMIPGSHFLEELNRELQMPESGRFYAIYTIIDNLVLPNESAKLTGDGAKNVETRIVNHVGLSFCKHTARLVKKCLEEN
jgi:pimeloyl-ACP methyl ester carboxylesterase